MPYIKLFLACAASWLLLLPLRAEAADLYSVIYSDASYYNGNPVECDWIANAVLWFEIFRKINFVNRRTI